MSVNDLGIIDHSSCTAATLDLPTFPRLWIRLAHMHKDPQEALGTNDFVELWGCVAYNPP